eukprot:2226160-Amphidinium_carterae.1
MLPTSSTMGALWFEYAIPRKSRPSGSSVNNPAWLDTVFSLASMRVGSYLCRQVVTCRRKSQLEPCSMTMLP